MDDVEPDEDRMEARRRHNRQMAELDREISEAAERRGVPAEQARPVTQIPALPGYGRMAAKHGQAAEDFWIDRMKAKYGGEP